MDRGRNHGDELSILASTRISCRFGRWAVRGVWIRETLHDAVSKVYDPDQQHEKKEDGTHANDHELQTGTEQCGDRYIHKSGGTSDAEWTAFE